MTIAIIVVAWLASLAGFVCLRLWVTRNESDHRKTVAPEQPACHRSAA
jgi:hypothetical protein